MRIWFENVAVGEVATPAESECSSAGFQAPHPEEGGECVAGNDRKETLGGSSFAGIKGHKSDAKNVKRIRQSVKN